jgi:hypothetical protein
MQCPVDDVPAKDITAPGGYFMRLNSFVSVLAALQWLYAGAAHSTEPSFEEISRCFWVYGSIFEAARDLSQPELFQFAQSRVAWVGGYIEANKSNAIFKKVFERDLQAHKRSAVHRYNSVRTAISSRNQSLFSSLIGEAISCDRQIGIKTGAIPRL